MFADYTLFITKYANILTRLPDPVCWAPRVPSASILATALPGYSPKRLAENEKGRKGARYNFGACLAPAVHDMLLRRMSFYPALLAKSGAGPALHGSLRTLIAPRARFLLRKAASALFTLQRETRYLR